MSTITQVGSYAKYIGLVRNLSNGQNNVDDLSRQMTTGKKSVDLKAYGPEVQKLLDLRAELVKRENYVQNIDSALPRVKATDVVLTRLEQLASDWQGSNLMPFHPGPVSITAPYNENPDGMKIKIDVDNSSFKQNARYTVTAVPSQTGVNGSFDVTVTDGLGGRTMRTLNLKTVPPDDGDGYNFQISGGAGDGAVLNISFDKLQSAANSSFTVSWPQANQMLDRVEGALRDLRQLLNERFGDRYLFSGSRFADEPVNDLLTGTQHSKVTFNGQMTNTDDYFEVTVNGQVFGYQLQAADPKTLTFIAGQLTSQINTTANPALPITVSTANGMITLIAQKPGQSFDVSSRVVNAAQVDNWASQPTNQQAATEALPQIERFTMTGANVDIGDTFEFSVTVGDKDDPYNQKYYNLYPNEPRDLPIYQEYKVRYTVTEQAFAAGVTNVTAVAAQMVTQFNAKVPAPPVTAAQTNGVVTLTSNTNLDLTNHPNRSTLFSASTNVINGSVNNSVTVAKLPPEADAITDVPYVDPPNLPFYDKHYLSKGKDEKAWDKARVTADDGLNITYGVVSTDKAFQTLIQAFRMARVAAANPGDYEENITKSRELMSQAKDEVRSVHAKVASDMATLEQQKEAHKQASNVAIERIASIEGIDQTEVAARLRAAMNSLEAAYTVAGKAQQLSLINYIA